MAGETQCTHFKDTVEGPTGFIAELRPEQGIQPLKTSAIRVLGSTAEALSLRIGPSRTQVPIYDGNPEGTAMTVDIAGMCNAGKIAVTRACSAEFCTGPNHANCTVFKNLLPES